MLFNLSVIRTYLWLVILQPTPSDDSLMTLFERHTEGGDQMDAKELKEALNELYIDGGLTKQKSLSQNAITVAA